MNIIEKRRRKAWAHATMVIMNKVIREASTGTIFIYGETLYGKDYFLTPDDALDAGATELPLNVCPFCGTSVMGERRDAVHG